ncbi:MAG: 16S rRNA (cytidine(1402)-2'-O)-methyltransferase [Saprospiraceae bacterium]|nr:16S rRNA (cytidine(1402)-2'-O)-methyltransferase [Saprospiraceae bacterium]
MLYLVPTPIGNLEDMTLRAIRVLKEVDVIYAEDTRTSGNLLKHFQIVNDLKPYHSFNEHKVVEFIVSQLVSGTTAALITDAGTPGISDPGFLLVRACREAGVKISCLPGPIAFVPALAASGLPSDAFYFEGFLPHKKGRQTAWKRLSELESTFILYESPHRLVRCLEEIKLYCGGERIASVAREISKMFEEQITATADELLVHFQQHAPKGEIVIVVEGKKK